MYESLLLETCSNIDELTFYFKLLKSHVQAAYSGLAYIVSKNKQNLV